MREVYRIELESGEYAMIRLGRKLSLPSNRPTVSMADWRKRGAALNAETAVMGKKKYHYPTFDMHVMPLFQSHKSYPQWRVGTCTTRTYILLLITNEFTARRRDRIS